MAIPVGIICASAGFLLNYILYIKDHETFSEFIQMLTTSPQDFVKNWFEYLVSLLSGMFMALFTYNSWMSIITQPGVSALLIPSYFPIVFSAAFGIGTFILLGSDMIGSQKDKSERNWITILKETWQQLTADDMDHTKKIKTMLGFAVVCIALYTLICKTYFPAATAALTFIPAPANTTFLVLMLVAIGLSEIVFNFKSFGKFFDFKYSSDGQSEKQTTEAAPSTLAKALVVSFIVLNALGNGIIGLGVGGDSLIYLICGALMSGVVMWTSNKNAAGNIGLQHHIDEISKIPYSNYIIPATWLGIAAIWLLPNLSLSIFHVAILASAGSTIFLGGQLLLSPEIAPIDPNITKSREFSSQDSKYIPTPPKGNVTQLSVEPGQPTM